MLWGGPGRDELYGEEDGDYLNGEEGSDLLDGGPSGDQLGDVYADSRQWPYTNILRGADGADTCTRLTQVWTPPTWKLASNILEGCEGIL